MEIRNIGIFAHVDAGKTTLSEKLLLLSGTIRKGGAVDDGTAHTDRMTIERRRGISVRATCARFIWKDTVIHLIDTPGHADFSAEVEKAMWALDGAVLLLDSSEGVQTQSEFVFEKLRENHIPTLLFFGKNDRPTADSGKTLESVRKKLHPACFLLGDDEANMAALAEESEEAMEAYLEGDVWHGEQLMQATRRAVHDLRVFPALSGSGMTGNGVSELLDALVTYLPSPDKGSDTPAGIVFALEEDPMMGRGAMVRLFSGALKNRESVSVSTIRRSEWGEKEITDKQKVTQIRNISLDGRGEDLGEISSGGIAVIYGLGEVKVGSVVGDRACLPRAMDIRAMRPPLMMVKVQPEKAEDRPAMHRALSRLSDEDPLLDVQLLGGVDHIRVMGEIQLEVLKELLPERFGLTPVFSEPEVIYRETISQPASGFVAYTMPKPCWAVMRFEIEPLPRGSGIRYSSVVPVRTIKERYQHQVEQALPLALSQGMLGWQVDDVQITLVDGSDHQFHTHPLDFIVATPMGILDGLMRGGSTLLEPIAEYTITLPSASGGKVMSEVVSMRGETVRTDSGDEDEMTIVCHVPVADSIHFPTRLLQLTGGRARLSMKLHGYRDRITDDPPRCPRRGVHPLDTSKYILAARAALEGNIF